MAGEMLCVPCKIIIDCGGAVTSASIAVSAWAAASAALRDTVLRADAEGELSEDAEYEAAAWSQLQCNRAMYLMKLCDGWRDETLAYGRKVAGVDYTALGWTIDGIVGISKSPSPQHPRPKG